MRVVLIIVVLVVLGFFVWQAAERFRLVEAPEPAAPEIVDDAADEDVEAPAARLPSFDIVRVDRSGYAVIAGRARPESEVTVHANGEPLETVVAESDGSWAMATETPLEAGTVELSLTMRTADGGTIRSDETIVIYVPEREGDRPLVVRTTPGGATEVLQEPRDPDGGQGPLTLDTIDYDDTGAVIFSGRAEPQRIVQIFINGQILDQTTSNAEGRWTISPGQTIAPGIYTLTVIQLDANGRPAYAIELPFERARPDQIQIREGRVIVQPGNSLWRISRHVYGRGAQYTIIYEANAAQIRDPDLIYPGQIFEIPETAPEGEESQDDGG